MFSLMWAWTNGWANNRDAGDMRRHRAHYDVTIMRQLFFFTEVSVIRSFCLLFSYTDWIPFQEQTPTDAVLGGIFSKQWRYSISIHILVIIRADITKCILIIWLCFISPKISLLTLSRVNVLIDRRAAMWSLAGYYSCMQPGRRFGIKIPSYQYILIIKIGRPHDRFIFKVEISILGTMAFILKWDMSHW